MPHPDLNLAIDAAERGMWSEVIDYLQRLPLAQINELEDRSKILDLAVEVLLQGDFEEQWDIAKIIPKLGEIAIQPLLDLVDEQTIDLEDRWFVARILGEFDRPEVVAKLVELVRQGEQPELSAMATESLAKIGISAIAALTDLLDTPDCAIAVTALTQIRHSQTIEPLLQTIDHQDPQIRALAIEALGSFHDPRIPAILIAKLKDLSATMRQAAVIALSLRSDSILEFDFVGHLQPLLFDLDLSVCGSTAIGLARSSDPRAVDVLTTLLASPRTPDVLKSQIILALGWIGTRSAVDSLATALVTASPDLAIEIVTSISRTESESDYASHILITYLHTNELPPAIKQEVAAALGNLGNIDSVCELIPLLGEPDDRVKLYAIAAIAKISPTIPPEILHLAHRSDLPSDLQIGIRMCLSHWQLPTLSP